MLAQTDPPDGDLTTAEPKTLRYRVLNATARLVRSGRRRRWKIAPNWPWAEAITRAWHFITTHPTHLTCANLSRNLSRTLRDLWSSRGIDR